jgi:glycosyltransferase involved in cell wall biosynthesis
MTGAIVPPLRVLITADAVGGVWSYVLALMEAVAPQHVSFTLAVTGPSPAPAALEHVARLSHVRIHTRTFRLEWMPEGHADTPAVCAWLRDLARTSGADVVHVNGYAAARAGFDCPTLVVAHSCVRSWWRAVHRTAAPSTWDAYSEAVRTGLNHADLIVAPTQAMATNVCREYDCRQPVQVIVNGIPMAPVPPTTKQPFVFAAGRFWDEGKNLGCVDAAAAMAVWPVFAAGSLTRPDGRDETPRHVRHLGVLDRSEVDRWLARAAIFAHPARYEPFGLAPLEAARAGCALVLGNIPTLREVWGGAALYVSPEDPVALRAALNRLSADPGLRERLGRAARVRAEYYTDRRMADAYLRCYRWLAGRAPVWRSAAVAADPLSSGVSSCAS